MVCNYITDYNDLVNANDTNDFTAYADRLIMYEALSHLMGENRQDQTMENSYFAKADREYQNIKLKGNNQLASGDLTIDTIL